MELIIELVSRAHKTIERHRFDKTVINIGRAYDNDLILPDPHISPHHARLTKQADGSWHIEDCGSMNGVYSRRHQRIETGEPVRSGNEYIIGKVHIRIFSPQHAVRPTVALSLMERSFNRLSQPVFFIAFLLITTGLLMANHYLNQYSEIKWEQFSRAVLGSLLAAALWASLWSLLGRVVRHEPRFIVQTIISLGYLVLNTLNDRIEIIIGFNTGSLATASAYGYISGGLLIAILIALNLRFATQQGALKRHLTAHIAAWSVIGLIVLDGHAKQSDFQYSPSYQGTLLPSAFHWSGTTDTADFLAESQALFNRPNTTE